MAIGRRVVERISWSTRFEDGLRGLPLGQPLAQDAEEVRLLDVLLRGRACSCWPL